MSRILSRSSSYSGFSKALGTRHAGSESNECNRIDAVFEIDEAAKMAGDISDDGSVGADESDRNDKGWVTSQECWKIAPFEDEIEFHISLANWINLKDRF